MIIFWKCRVWCNTALELTSSVSFHFLKKTWLVMTKYSLLKHIFIRLLKSIPLLLTLAFCVPSVLVKSMYPSLSQDTAKSVYGESLVLDISSASSSPTFNVQILDLPLARTLLGQLSENPLRSPPSASCLWIPSCPIACWVDPCVSPLLGFLYYHSLESSLPSHFNKCQNIFFSFTIEN